jgi:ribosomal protein S18 acetylase RimI-like enzyme
MDGRSSRPGGNFARHGMELRFRCAERRDIPALLRLIHAAYREEGEGSGWTTEAHLLEGPRIERAELEALIDSHGSRIVLAAEARRAAGLKSSTEPLGCCHIAGGGEEASLGLLAVRPEVQSRGVGRALVAEAERLALRLWHAQRIAMRVIVQRDDIIAWYERLGYSRTEERVPFPYRPGAGAKRQDLEFAVLRKSLYAAATRPARS